MPPTETLKHYQAILIALEQAAYLQLNSAQEAHLISQQTKSDGSVLTEIDLLSEKIIIEAIIV